MDAEECIIQQARWKEDDYKCPILLLIKVVLLPDNVHIKLKFRMYNCNNLICV